MLSAMVYPVSRLISLLGPARSVTAFVNNLIPHRLLDSGNTLESDIDDNVSLIIEWRDGQQVICRTLFGTSLNRFDATVYGRRGTLWLSEGQLVIHSPRRAISETTPVTFDGTAEK